MSTFIIILDLFGTHPNSVDTAGMKRINGMHERVFRLVFFGVAIFVCIYFVNVIHLQYNTTTVESEESTLKI